MGIFKSSLSPKFDFDNKEYVCIADNSSMYKFYFYDF